VLSLEDAARQPAELVNTFFFRGAGGPKPREPFDVPEREKDYPEPSMFGLLPAYGFFFRHVRGIELNGVGVGFMQEDRRPAFVFDDVKRAWLTQVSAQKASGVPSFVLKNIEDFRLNASALAADIHLDKVARKEF
jgi:hypothetical protein